MDPGGLGYAGIQLMEETMHNLHHESHKFVHRIKLMHWFHKHANTAVVYQLMPNFGQATLVVSDLPCNIRRERA